MSQINNKLEKLIARVTEVRQSLELESFLHSMQFFALLEFLHIEQITELQITDTLVSYAGAIFAKLEELSPDKKHSLRFKKKLQAIFQPT